MTRVLSSGKATLVMLAVILVIQMISTSFFVLMLLADVFMWQNLVIPWALREVLEILSVFGMLLGVGASAVLIYLSVRHAERIDGQIEVVAGEFQKHLDRQFADWGLTPTERTVSILVMKGFSNAEIAAIRGTTESTAKSQLTSVFRKTGLSSRQQLTTHLIEDMLNAINENA